MPDAFDPYFKWLGIPKADQPPHGYRLLGIELFESDADVISNAADGRMAQIKNFQSGKFAAVSQKLLNEIAAAKVCLLNPQKKAEYDRRLRAHLQQKNAATDAKVNEPEVAGAGGPAEDAVAGLPFLDYSTTPKLSMARPPKKSKSRQPAWLIPVGVGLGTIALVTAVLTYFFAGDAKNKPVNPQTASLAGGDREAQSSHSKSPAKPAVGTSEPSPKPTGSTSTTVTEKTHVPASLPRAVPTPPTPISTPEPETKPRPKIELVAEPEKTPSPSAPLPTGEGSKSSPPAPLPKVEGSKKSPVPDKQQYQAMKSKILKIFQKEFAEAKTPESKLALAVKLDKQGDAAKDDPVERYSLWHLAADGASAAGEFSKAMEIVDKIQGQFDADGDAMKADTLGTGAGCVAITPEAAHDLCEAALKLAAAAAAREDWEAAAQFAKLATTAAHRAKDPQFSREVLTRGREIEHLKTRYAVVAKALETLASDGENAEANLVVGQWHCFAKDNWERGLPYLAKGGRADLAGLAKQELAKPAAANDLVALADAWWALAEKDRTDAKSSYQARAIHWYERAAPGLSGLEKIRVDKQIAATKQGPAGQPAVAGPGSKSFGPRGAVQKGNVALLSLGATVSGVKDYPTKMLNPDDKAPFSYGPVPCEFIVNLDKVYQLQQIRFLIPEGDLDSYQIYISRDGRKFDLLQDYSRERMQGWQEFRFAARPVKAIKMASAAGFGGNFHVERLEAYCYATTVDGSPNPHARRTGR